MDRTNRNVRCIVVCLHLFSAWFAVADGGIVVYEGETWRMFDEEQQFCAINFHDGMQRMLLTVNTTDELRGDRAVWIFPIPSEPEEVDIDILEGFPVFRGFDVLEEWPTLVDYIRLKLEIASLNFALTQGRLGFVWLSLAWHGGLGPMKESGFAEEGLEVHSTSRHRGLTAELVSTRSVDTLSAYLIKKRVDLPIEFKAILDEYIGESYSFVISWISDVGELAAAQRANSADAYSLVLPVPADGNQGETPARQGGTAISLYVSFPTEKIYYPLKPTAVYGNSMIPVVVYVIGFVQPNLYDGIAGNSQVSYFWEADHPISDNLKLFYDFEDAVMVKNLPYTKVAIEAPSSHLGSDLWIDDKTPPSLVGHLWILEKWNQYFVPIYVAYFVVLSLLSGLIAALITFGHDHLLIFSLFGLLNVLTLGGYWGGVGLVKRFYLQKQSWFLEANPGRRLAAALVALGLLVSVFVYLSLSGKLPFPLSVSIPLTCWWFVLIAVSGYRKNKPIRIYCSYFSMIFMVLLLSVWAVLAAI